MSFAIHKYRLNASMFNQPQDILMPAGANVLSVAFQKGEPGSADLYQLSVWAEVDSRRGMVPRGFYIAFTGSEFPDRAMWNFVTTIFFREYVLHIYERSDRV